MSRLRISAERVPSGENSNETYTREIEKFICEFNEDFTASELNLVCRRMAAALGYAEASIDECFAPIAEDRYNSGPNGETLEDIIRIALGQDNGDDESQVRQISENLFQKILAVLRYVNNQHPDLEVDAILTEIKKTYEQK